MKKSEAEAKSESEATNKCSPSCTDDNESAAAAPRQMKRERTAAETHVDTSDDVGLSGPEAAAKPEPVREPETHNAGEDQNAKAPAPSVSFGSSGVEIKICPGAVASPSANAASRPSLDNPGDKGAFDVFSDYVANLFKRAEVSDTIRLLHLLRANQCECSSPNHHPTHASSLQTYEEELELRQSQINLRRSMNQTRHGSVRRSLVSPEGHLDDASDDDETPAEKGARLGALAALDALANFRDLEVVQEESKTAPQVEQHQEEATAVVDTLTKEEWKQQWDVFVGGKKKNKLSEVAIQVGGPTFISQLNYECTDEVYNLHIRVSHFQ